MSLTHSEYSGASYLPKGEIKTFKLVIIPGQL